MSESRDPESTVEEAVTRPVLLKQAREAAGLHIAALAAALKVPVRKLEALEAGRYDELPDLTFARALASSACRQLKIDPAPVLAQLPASPTPALGDKQNALNAPFKGGSEAPASSPLGWLSKPAVLGVIALMLGALVIMFLPAVGPAPEVVSVPVLPTDAVAPAPATPVIAEPAATVTEPAPVPEVGAAGANNPTSAAPATEAANPDASTSAVASADQTAASASAPLLVLTASEASWAEVVNGTGTVVLQRNLQPGERVEFSAAPPYAVVLGRAEVVQVSVRGRPFDTRPVVRNNVARFEVK